MSDGGCYKGPGGRMLHGSGREVASRLSDEGLLIGRRKKARRISAAIASLGATLEDAKQLSSDEWLMADQLSHRLACKTCHGTGIIFRPHLGKETPCLACDKTKRAPSPETRALVLEYLAQWPKDEDCPQ